MLGDWGVVVVLLDGSVLAKSDCFTGMSFKMFIEILVEKFKIN